MRLGVLAGRQVIIDNDRAVDVAKASNGRFGPDPTGVLDNWSDFRAWRDATPLDEGLPFDVAELENPVPEPKQVFAIGLNYAEHAAESHYEVPTFPPVFTKYRSSLAGPRGDVEITGPKVDWEVELVAVLGEHAHRVSEDRGWDYIAGVTVGQDISDREAQFNSNPPQFSLGKSYPGFSPLGPVLVTVDELDNADDLELGCDVNGEQVQHGRTSELIFSVPQLISRLSHITPLYPGDLIFTGTPSGVGWGRQPQRFLAVGDVLRSYVTGIGELEQRFVAAGSDKELGA